MQFLEEEISQVASTVWESVLGIGLVRQPVPPPSATRSVSGCVQITGAWEGACLIECSAEFARRAAGTMFGVEPSAASAADTRDAIGELANMTGGNLKALLPEPCRLSLPTVFDGDDSPTCMPGSEVITTVAFDCEGSLLVVRLLKTSIAGASEEGPLADLPVVQRREFSRVPVHLRAEVSVDGARLPEGTIESLSLKGGFFRSPAAPALGARVDVRLHLEGTEVEVHVQGHVVRVLAEGSALQFDEIVGVDSLEHLRNLILFNSHNPSQVELEFHQHLGLRRDD